MKILFVATDYPERGKPTTGFPNYLYRVSTALVQMGHEPIILAAGRMNSHRIEQAIDIWTIKMKYINTKIQALDFVINAIRKGYLLNRKLEELLGKMSIDVVQFTSLEGIAMFYRGKVPAVMRLSSYAKTYFASLQTWSFMTVKIMSLLERMSSRRCNLVFAPCKITAESFGHDCKRKVKVIETPFLNDIQVYDNKYVDTYLKDKKYALFFGTIYAEKGVLVIAEILEEFLRTNPCYYFVFVGDATTIKGEESGHLLRRMAGKYKNRVIIWEALPHKQLYPIIQKAELVVLPSLMDNFPNACIESMYFGKVVIGTNGASFEQLITHGKNGLLCKIGDSQDLFNKMQMAVSMSAEQKWQMGKKASERIEKLNPQYVVKKLLHLYDYVIAKSK